MTEPELSRCDSRQLAELLQLEGDHVAWSPEDIGAILSHLLSSPLQPELVAFDPGSKQVLDDLQRLPGETFHTVRDLLTHNEPPVWLLTLVKRYAKHHGQTSGLLPKDVAGLIYLAAISAALVHCDQRISEFDDATLAKRLEWGRNQSTLDDCLRALFEAALERIRSGSQPHAES